MVVLKVIGRPGLSQKRILALTPSCCGWVQDGQVIIRAVLSARAFAVCACFSVSSVFSAGYGHNFVVPPPHRSYVIFGERSRSPALPFSLF